MEPPSIIVGLTHSLVPEACRGYKGMWKGSNYWWRFYMSINTSAHACLISWKRLTPKFGLLWIQETAAILQFYVYSRRWWFSLCQHTFLLIFSSFEIWELRTMLYHKFAFSCLLLSNTIILFWWQLCIAINILCA